MTSRVRGAALLEVLVALTLLGTVGGAAAWSTTESLRAVERMHAREAEQRRADRLLTAISLWPRADLDRHLGDRPEGAWRLEVNRPSPTIYVVTVRDSLSGAVLAQTALYRDETDR